LPHRAEAAKRTRLERIVRQQPAMLVDCRRKEFTRLRTRHRGDTELRSVCPMLWAKGRDHRRSAAALRLHGVCGDDRERQDAAEIRPDPQVLRTLVWCCLTPELSRPARCGTGRSETAKRARLERIVSPLRQACHWATLSNISISNGAAVAPAFSTTGSG
jgi:hypothetical protein